MPTPETGPGQVLLRTRCVGVCVSDVYYYRGTSTAPHFPIVPGHEYVGEVVESRCESVVVGQRLAYWGGTEFGGLAEYRALRPIFPETLDDTPWRDRRGFYDADGAAAVRVDPGLPDALAPLLEPLCSALRTLVMRPARPGDTAVVIGAGPIGLIALQVLLRLQGCASVTVLERDPVRLARARELGAGRAFHVHDDRRGLEQLIDASDGRHAQYVFDTLSNAEGDVRSLAMRLLEPRGLYLVFGASERPQSLDTWPLLSKGLELSAVPFDVRALPMRRSAAVLALGQSLALHGLIELRPLVSRVADFTDEGAVRAAFEHYGGGGALKTLVRFPDATQA